MFVLPAVKQGPYEYLAYHSGNHSADIRDLFVATRDSIGVHCSVSAGTSASTAARRSSSSSSTWV